MSSTVKGIDVSHYQGTVNWADVAASGAAFTFIKATQGTSYVDPMFQTNWRGAKAAGLKCGAYLFFEPNVSFLDQAELFIHQLKTAGYDRTADLLPAIDCEVASGVTNSEFSYALSQLLNILEIYLRVKPLIYTSPGFWSSVGNPDFSAYPLWVAEYTTAPAPTLPPDWTSYAFWQYSQSGTVSGISGAVDLDVMGTALAARRTRPDWF
ncbi:glycoside hydrolase family 25 protein [Pannonibacter phragmitetus]|uniref:glycoside hydrolase family 25 protein n=1 Tax=Pannonibacter phragmitetus TaxID=121719 RepID=UPI003D2F1D1C